MKKNKLAKIILVIVVGLLTYYASFHYTRNMEETMNHDNARSRIKVERKKTQFPKSSSHSLPTKPGQVDKAQRAPAAQKPVDRSYVQLDNTVDEYWEDNLVDSLESLAPDTKVKIHSQKDIIKRVNNRSLNLKNVVVEIAHPTKGTSTYRALVDPSSGKIIKTWDKSRFEDFTGRNRFQMTYQGP